MEVSQYKTDFDAPYVALEEEFGDLQLRMVVTGNDGHSNQESTIKKYVCVQIK